MSMRDRVQAARAKTPQHLYPLWSAWRQLNQEHQFSSGAIEMAVEILARRQRTYEYMRHSPSSGGHCIRQSVLMFNGYKGDRQHETTTLHKFDDGNFKHLRWQMFMYDMGILTAAEVPVFMPEWGVAGTCDGLVTVPLKGYDPAMTREEVLLLCNSVPVWNGLLEIKAMASYRYRNNVSTQIEPKVQWQGDLYKTAAERTLPSKLDGVTYWFENKDTNDVREFSVPVDMVLQRKMGEFYTTAMDHFKDGTLPGRPYEQGSRMCNWCDLQDMCDRLERKGKTTIKPAKGAKMGNWGGIK